MAATEHKFVCDKCNFKCDYESKWNLHINTELHKTGKKKKRSDTKPPFQCEYCNYETKNIVTMKTHILNEHSNIDQRQKEFKYYCSACDFGTFSKDIINTHLNTARHKKRLERQEIS